MKSRLRFFYAEYVYWGFNHNNRKIGPLQKILSLYEDLINFYVQ